MGKTIPKEKLDKWLDKRYSGWRIAYTPNPESDVSEDTVADIILWATREYNGEFRNKIARLIQEREPSKTPIEIYNDASMQLSDSTPSERFPYWIHIRSSTPLAIGFFILELERNDGYLFGYIKPAKQHVNNLSMAEIIERHKEMARDYLKNY